jgi:serine/threonine-protein kinase
VVPQLTGRLQADALDLIRNANLSSGTIRERQSSQTTGIVVEQRPAAGTPVPRGTAIDFVVAIPAPVTPVPVPQPIAPPPPPVKITVPDLRGRSQNDAAAAIQDLKLLVGPIAERESAGSRGIILEQDPQPGALVDPGTPISLWLAIAIAPVVQPAPTPPPPVLVVVPRVVEGPIEQALVAIRAAGLQPGTVTQTPAAVAAGIITFQTPAAGIQVTPGTLVDLIVSVPLAQAEASELPLIWLIAGLVTGLVVAAAASLSRAPRNRLAGSPTLMPHADEGQQTSVPGDGSLVDFEVSLDPHSDRGAQMLEEKPGLIAGEWSGTQVMSW